MTVSDSDRIMKSCFIPVGWLLTVGYLALIIAQETDGIICRPGLQEYPQTMHNNYRACAPPIIRPHPLIYTFLPNSIKRDPPDPRNR